MAEDLSTVLEQREQARRLMDALAEATSELRLLRAPWGKRLAVVQDRRGRVIIPQGAYGTAVILGADGAGVVDDLGPQPLPRPLPVRAKGVRHPTALWLIPHDTFSLRLSVYGQGQRITWQDELHVPQVNRLFRRLLGEQSHVDMTLRQVATLFAAELAEVVDEPQVAAHIADSATLSPLLNNGLRKRLGAAYDVGLGGAGGGRVECLAQDDLPDLVQQLEATLEALATTGGMLALQCAQDLPESAAQAQAERISDLFGTNLLCVGHLSRAIGAQEEVDRRLLPDAYWRLLQAAILLGEVLRRPLILATSVPDTAWLPAVQGVLTEHPDAEEAAARLRVPFGWLIDGGEALLQAIETLRDELPLRASATPIQEPLEEPACGTSADPAEEDPADGASMGPLARALQARVYPSRWRRWGYRARHRVFDALYVLGRIGRVLVPLGALVAALYWGYGRRAVLADVVERGRQWPVWTSLGFARPEAPGPVEVGSAPLPQATDTAEPSPLPVDPTAPPTIPRATRVRTALPTPAAAAPTATSEPVYVVVTPTSRVRPWTAALDPTLGVRTEQWHLPKGTCGQGGMTETVGRRVAFELTFTNRSGEALSPAWHVQGVTRGGALVEGCLVIGGNTYAAHDAWSLADWGVLPPGERVTRTFAVFTVEGDAAEVVSVRIGHGDGPDIATLPLPG